MKPNPAEISLATTTYETRLIAFLDIVGFQSFVDSTRAEHGSSKVEEFFSYFKTKISDGVRTLGPSGAYLPSVTVFSDSIVIAYPLDLFNFHKHLGNLRPENTKFPAAFNHDRSMLLFSIAATVGHMQEYCLKFDLLMRGAITIGEIYINGNVWFGPGLNSAYEHENRIAKFPRVILTREAYDFFKAEIQTTEGKTNFVTCDSDGYYFITPFHWVPNDETVDDGRLAFRETIARNLVSTKDDSLEAHQKWQWIAKYFNGHVANKDRCKSPPIPAIDID